MAKRIDFKHVRQHADMAQVLAAYDIELKKDGSKPGQFKALCPFHEDTKPSLKVNTERNIYNCFACNAGGNVLEFVMAMDGVGLRPAAEQVADICGIALSPGANNNSTKQRSAKPSRPPAAPETPAEPPADLPAANTPLNFELKLTQDEELSTWLSERGITPEAIKTFGLGRASKRSKLIGNRLGIPVHNTAGELIAYCGRYLGDAKADDVPKYILPSEFHKSLELFNLHRLTRPCDYVLIFESYLSVMRHHTHVPCVSPFGRDLSLQQLTLLSEPDAKRFIIVFDGDEPGRTGAQQAAGQLAELGWVRVVTLPDGCKPHHLSWSELRDYLAAIWPSK